jgi:hypothetical protein
MSTAQAAKPDLPPKLTVALYAPLQKESPVHIEGFEHSQSEIQFVLSSTSDKSVVGVVIDRVDISPVGCVELKNEMDRGIRGLSGASFELRIVPHGKAVASRAGIFRVEDIPPQGVPYPHLTGVTPRNASNPHYPKSVVLNAREAGAAIMQAQFGVTGIFFDDGTTWPAPINLGYRPDPFDSHLVQSEAGKCTDVAAIAKALESVQEVVFERQVPTVPSKGDDAVAVPHLRFSCSLEGPKAVCRLPLETNPSTPHPQLEAPEQK